MTFNCQTVKLDRTARLHIVGSRIEFDTPSGQDQYGFRADASQLGGYQKAEWLGRPVLLLAVPGTPTPVQIVFNSSQDRNQALEAIIKHRSVRLDEKRYV